MRDGVEGDLIEAGAWRGGAAILMRATLDSLGATDRTVHVADSFQGFPAADELGDLNANDFLAVPVEEVRESFARFGLDARRARSCRASSRRRCRRSPTERWAVVRLDGDTYEATRAALDALYPRPGGRRLPDRRRLPRHGRRGMPPRGRRVPRASTASPSRWRRSTGRASAGGASDDTPIDRRRAGAQPPADRTRGAARVRRRRTCRPVASSSSSARSPRCGSGCSDRSWRRRLAGRAR